MYSVRFIFRKPVPHFFSIERVFGLLLPVFKKIVQVEETVVPYYSSSLANIARNIWYARQQKADIYHVTGEVHYLTLAYSRRNTILTIHDCNFLYMGGPVRRWFFSRLFLQWPVAHCAAVTTISEKSRQEIIRYSGCPPAKVTVIPNPVDGLIRYSKKAFNSQKPALLFVGSTPNKNLERVIAAIKGLSCRLSIIGKPTAEQLVQLQEAAIDYTACSGLTGPELAEQYAAADIVLFPSLYEGFGLPVIEGQQAGRVVVTSNISPMKEVAGGGACLVDPLSAEAIRQGIKRVIEDEAYRNSLVERGFANVRNYSVEAVADQYASVYEKILSTY